VINEADAAAEVPCGICGGAHHDQDCDGSGPVTESEASKALTAAQLAGMARIHNAQPRTPTRRNRDA
jgi:hypothetical protein